ncbi:CPBP family glutamic-type intramembrane protease [Nonomuraea polychroma]|uniref:CPBP family intramembrane glutamic endopeptidase n=1 Tax=Nonomuraea polychroma TaxID=46176 RepID=UPI003D931031
MQENPGPHLPYGTPYTAPSRSWFLPTLRGARYDHLARNGVARPWRAIVGTIAIAALFLVVAAVVLSAGAVVATLLGIPAPLDPERGLFGDPVFGLTVTLLSLALVLPFVFGAAALLQRRRPGTLSSVAGRLRWPWLLACVGLAILALVLGQIVTIFALVVTGEQHGDMFGWVGWERFLPALIVIVLLVPFQSAAEEYVFRGWFLQAVGAHVRNPVWGILIGAALFASVHGYSWAGLADVFAFGAVVGWLAVRTGGLEAGIALHVMNNMLAFGISAAAGTIEDALIQSKVVVPWQAIVGVMVQLGAYAFGVVYLAKKRSISTVSG